MERFSPHARFFSSLDQVEERLTFEKKNQRLSPQAVESILKPEFKEYSFSSSQSDSLGSPLCLVNPNAKPVDPDNSGPAVDFLSDTETQQEEERVGDETDLVKAGGGGNKLKCIKDRRFYMGEGESRHCSLIHCSLQ